MLKVEGISDVHIELPNGTALTPALLKETVHVPNMAFTLITIGKLDHASYSVTFTNNLCTIKNSARKIIAMIPRTDGL